MSCAALLLIRSRCFLPGPFLFFFLDMPFCPGTCEGGGEGQSEKTVISFLCERTRNEARARRNDQGTKEGERETNPECFRIDPCACHSKGAAGALGCSTALDLVSLPTPCSSLPPHPCPSDGDSLLRLRLTWLAWMLWVCPGICSARLFMERGIGPTKRQIRSLGATRLV